jgi:cyclopropane fatty-acyl-phospholipid synthase-like methyltransferase
VSEHGSPWLQIPIRDYEAHMDRIGQSEALREIFARACMETRPRRLLVLGCSAGGDFPLVDPEVTQHVVGVDLNPEAIEEARRRGAERCCADVRLIAADVLDVALPKGGFDLIHAALVLEYVDPLRLFERIAGWLDPDGACVTVTQTPMPGIAAVSCTGQDRLHLLSPAMTLRTPGQVEAIALRAGLRRRAARDVPLPGGKRFAVAEFRKAGR